MRITPKQLVFLGFIALPFVTVSQVSSPASLQFSPTAITDNAKTFWVCGPEGKIASSPNGDEWQIRDTGTNNSLLAIGWANDKFGFSGGTGGTVIITSDGGSTWKPLPTSFAEPVLDLSFSDENHGIVQTTSSVLYTSDGGAKWQSILPNALDTLSGFKHVQKVASLDADHATVLLKAGGAQYYDGRLYSTVDSGLTWKVTEIEHTTLNNLLVLDREYWLVGTEVIDRTNHSGHAVPVTFHSVDAVKWDRGPRPLIDVNNACQPEGCLMWNGAWFDPFHANGQIHTFPEMPDLTVQWASVDDRMCVLTPALKCLNASPAKTLPEHGGPVPPLLARELKPTDANPEGKCIRCDFQRVFVTDKKGGRVSTQLHIVSRPDGSTDSVEILSTDDKDIGAKLAQSASSWLFYPVKKKGQPIATERTITLTVNAVQSPTMQPPPH